LIPSEAGGPAHMHRTLHLDCGHQIELPPEVAVPALAAFLVQHQLSCRGLESPSAPDRSSGYSLPIVRGVGNR
jgi:hypothetical protein